MTSVLLVDPFSDEREMYRYCLDAAGFAVHPFSDSQLACKAAVHLAPDVIVARLHQLQPPDGIELTRRCRKCNATNRIPIVILTTSIKRDDRRAAKSAGCDSYLLLPCLPDLIVAEVRRLTSIRLNVTPQTMSSLEWAAVRRHGSR